MALMSEHLSLIEDDLTRFPSIVVQEHKYIERISQVFLLQARDAFSLIHTPKLNGQRWRISLRMGEPKAGASLCVRNVTDLSAAFRKAGFYPGS